MQTFIAPQHQALLEQNQLDSFDQIWNYKTSWFEEPNSRRGGWSGVGRLVLKDAQGKEQGVFLKRQENHQRRTYLHPFQGEPTFACEFKMMRYLASQGVPVPTPMFFSQHGRGEKAQAILITEELLHFTPLETVTEELFLSARAGISTRRSILRGVASTVKKMHAAGIQHRSLYPKHLFVRMTIKNDPEVVVIDLEKSRRKLVPPLRTIYDLATLNRHAKYWSRTERLYFFKHYMGLRHLTPWAKFLCRLIYKRSHRPK